MPIGRLEGHCKINDACCGSTYGSTKYIFIVQEGLGALRGFVLINAHPVDDGSLSTFTACRKTCKHISQSILTESNSIRHMIAHSNS
eukprot:1443642-Amphidinium_carterae.2